MDNIHWWQIIGRVSRGLATADDADAISEHLRLPGIARDVRQQGGNDNLARHLQVNLWFIRKWSLARYGFREVRR